MRVRVDRTLCETYAMCVFTAPDVFALDDNDELVYVEVADDGLGPDIEEASRACPVQAISLDET